MLDVRAYKYAEPNEQQIAEQQRLLAQQYGGKGAWGPSGDVACSSQRREGGREGSGGACETSWGPSPGRGRGGPGFREARLERAMRPPWPLETASEGSCRLPGAVAGAHGWPGAHHPASGHASA